MGVLLTVVYIMSTGNVRLTDSRISLPGFIFKHFVIKNISKTCTFVILYC